MDTKWPGRPAESETQSVPAEIGGMESICESGASQLHSEALRRIALDVAAVRQIPAVPTLLQVLCEISGMQFAAVVRAVERNWTLCAVKDDIQTGLEPGNHLDADTISWMRLKRSGAPIVISQAIVEDPTRHTRGQSPAITSSVSAPIILGNGEYFGNLCAIGLAPIELPTQVGGLSVHFAAIVASELDRNQVREDVEVALRDERAAGVLREQFISILGHDLKNPLQAIFATSDLLLRQVRDPTVVRMAARIKSNSKRMSSMIDDVFDLARSRQGGGIGLHLAEIEDINVGLTSVVNELLDGQPGRRIEYSFHVDRSVKCDLSRLQQMASNLIGNALTHGAANRAIRVTATADEHDLVFEVWNEGEPIPPDSLTKVFEPYWRQDTSPSRNGLGLGLHICAQIMRAHGGQLSVRSTREAGTTFTARVPLRSTLRVLQPPVG